jgi:hypothetical protein
MAAFFCLFLKFEIVGERDESLEKERGFHISCIGN